MKYIWNILIAIDQLVNTVFGGQPDETISAKAYRMRVEKNSFFWKNAEKVINLIFFDEKHCEKSANSELSRKQIASWYKK
jgi:hypothetical protein